MKNNIDKYDLSKISNPNDVKNLTKKEISALCSSLREEILRITSMYGGHLSSNLGTVELTVALCRVFHFPKDKLIFDVGHQSYSWKILTGRNLEHLNQEGHISGFQKMREGPYDVYEAGHSGTAVSAALSFLDARTIQNKDYEIVAVVGDGAIGNGVTLEALNDMGRRESRVILIINDNAMAISPSRGAISHSLRSISLNKNYIRFKEKIKSALQGTRSGKHTIGVLKKFRDWAKNVLVGSNFFDDLGFLYLGPVDGHNVEALERILKKALRADGPVVVHIKTTKGKGYPYAEEDEKGYWHGVTPFDVESGKPTENHPDMISWSHFMGDETLKFMSNPTFALICPAMAKGSHMEEAFQAYPNRCFDPGIAEEHAITYSGALSLCGIHPIVSIYSTFLQRSYDELLHDCARMNVGLTLLIDRAGLCGSNGDTHQGIYDPAFLMSIPNIKIMMPRTFMEADACYRYSLTHQEEICAIRYPHSLEKKEENVFSDKNPCLWEIDGEGNLPLFIGVGPLGYKMQQYLKSISFPFKTLSFSLLYPFDEGVKEKILSSSKIFVYDPYGTKDGFLDHFMAYLFENHYQGEFKGRAIPNTYIDQGSVSSQLERYQLDPKSIKDEVLSFFKK